MLASEKEVLSAAIRDVRPGRPDRADRPDRAAGDGPPGALIFPPGAARWYTIGREPDCDLLIGDLTVSRKHARLERAAEGWLLTDLGSTNGTRLNGWRIREPVRLRAGDRVAFGSAVFVMSGPG
jgi:pSer/pThr/pTyr-binding forkhead associated (FHA) protein